MIFVFCLIIDIIWGGAVPKFLVLSESSSRTTLFLTKLKQIGIPVSQAEILRPWSSNPDILAPDGVALKSFFLKNGRSPLSRLTPYDLNQMLQQWYRSSQGDNGDYTGFKVFYSHFAILELQNFSFFDVLTADPAKPNFFKGLKIIHLVRKPFLGASLSYLEKTLIAEQNLQQPNPILDLSEDDIQHLGGLFLRHCGLYHFYNRQLQALFLGKQIHLLTVSADDLIDRLDETLSRVHLFLKGTTISSTTLREVIDKGFIKERRGRAPIEERFAHWDDIAFRLPQVVVSSWVDPVLPINPNNTTLFEMLFLKNRYRYSFPKLNSIVALQCQKQLAADLLTFSAID